jgi:hypothetical protein
VKTNDIDALLKKSFNKEFSPPPELDAATWQKMEAVPHKKTSFFMTLASTVISVLLVMETIVLLSFIQLPALKIMLLYLYISTICVIVFFKIISTNINLKHKFYE